jgi:hypothetical protein
LLNLIGRVTACVNDTGWFAIPERVTGSGNGRAVAGSSFAGNRFIEAPVSRWKTWNLFPICPSTHGKCPEKLMGKIILFGCI